MTGLDETPFYNNLRVKNLYLYVAGGLRAILTDQNKLVVAVGGVTALAAGVYTTRYTLTMLLLVIADIFSSCPYFKNENSAAM